MHNIYNIVKPHIGVNITVAEVVFSCFEKNVKKLNNNNIISVIFVT